MTTINKNCIYAFSETAPLVALATKTKLFDASFALTSELILFNYKTNKQTSQSSEYKFCSIAWNDGLLITGHENGYFSCYKVEDDQLVHLYSTEAIAEKCDITAIEFVNKRTALLGTSTGIAVVIDLKTNKSKSTVEVNRETAITCFAWNTKVSKIVAVGTKNGEIKFINLRSLCVMNEIENDYQTIKDLQWDEGATTRVIVRSEKNVLISHDLSEGKVQTWATAQEPIIGFNKNTLCTSNEIKHLASGTVTKIEESSNCLIGPIDGMVALTRIDNSIEILKLPTLPKKRPHVRIGNKVFTLNSVKTVGEYKSSRKYELKKGDQFYDELLELRQNNRPSEEVADLLVKNSAYRIPANKTGLEIDVEDEKTLKLLRGDFSALKNFDQKISISKLHGLLEHDDSVLSSSTSFPEFMAFAKLLGNFSHVERIKNSRLLAALLLYNKFSDFSTLSSDREATILRGILTGDSSSSLNNRIVIGPDFHENIFQINHIFSQITNPVESEYLKELFWYKISRGEFDEVKEMKILDGEIQSYVSNQESSSVSHKLKGINLNQNTTAGIMGSSSLRQQQPNNTMRQQQNTIQSSSSLMGQPSMNRPQTPSTGSVGMNRMGTPMMGQRTSMMNNRPAMGTPGNASRFNTPSMPTNNAMGGRFNTPSAGASRFNQSPPVSNLSNARVNTPPSSSMGMPNQANRINTPMMGNNNMGQSNPMGMITPGMGNRAMGNTQGQCNTMGMGNRTMGQGNNNMGQCNSIGQNNSMNQSTVGMNNRMNTPVMGNRTMGQSNTMGNNNMGQNNPMSQNNMGINNNSGMGMNRSTPKIQMPKSPMMASRDAMNKPMGMPMNKPMGMPMNTPFKSPAMPTRGMGANINRPQQQDSSQQQNSQVFDEFDRLIFQVKDKAAQRHSILLNQKKERLMQILSYYNPNTVTPDQVKGMERLIQRMKNVDASLKTDIDQMELPSTNWMNALIDLIKIGY